MEELGTESQGKILKHSLDKETSEAEEPPTLDSTVRTENSEVPSAKRIKLDESINSTSVNDASSPQRIKGVAPVKAEYLITQNGGQLITPSSNADDDAAEASGYKDRGAIDPKSQQKLKKRGQNTARKFGSSNDSLGLCSSVATSPEFSPKECKFGTKCRFEHDIRKYLKEGRREDLKTFGGVCPVWEAHGVCNAGWKCRFVGSHSREREDENGRKELILVEDPARANGVKATDAEEGFGIVNVVSAQQKHDLARHKTKTPKSDMYTQWMNKRMAETGSTNEDADEAEGDKDETPKANGATQKPAADGTAKSEREDHRAKYVEAPFLPSEKRRIYYGPETPVLAPLTTQGNLPFRRLCVDLGAQVTWSEMAMGIPLVKGEKSEWALMKAHESELLPPKVSESAAMLLGYDNSRDLKFGAQIAANKPWIALKTTEVLTELCPHLRAIDLNCGCPIDLVYRQGAGSALLDAPSKLEKILRGMNALSGEIPITVKIRMGTKDNRPTAYKLAERLLIGGDEARLTGEGPAGIAAITLHGRSRQQRYSRHADWSYISECAALIKRLNAAKDLQTDTIAEADPRNLQSGDKVYFIGNGDCYSHADYYSHIEESKVDTVMVARGALFKPWIFEEIEKGQYLDKSASERLEYIEKFVKYGLEAWGSDERGIGTTRRFLLEWLSFSYRYVPIGILEHLPPHIQDRPPAFRGRNDLESLLSSDNYKDWIKISEMFLGPAHPDFKFEPKHKSNSYDTEISAEG